MPVLGLTGLSDPEARDRQVWQTTLHGCSRGLVRGVCRGHQNLDKSVLGACLNIVNGRQRCMACTLTQAAEFFYSCLLSWG